MLKLYNSLKFFCAQGNLGTFITLFSVLPFCDQVLLFFIYSFTVRIPMRFSFSERRLHQAPLKRGLNQLTLLGEISKTLVHPPICYYLKVRVSFLYNLAS